MKVIELNTAMLYPNRTAPNTGAFSEAVDNGMAQLGTPKIHSTRMTEQIHRTSLHRGRKIERAYERHGN